jgi:membrane-bound lytic murein transglycosylase D
MKIFKIILSVSLFLGSAQLFAQVTSDSSKTELGAIEQQTVFLDSLPETWNVKQSTDPNKINSDNIIREEPDSVYIDRIKRINSPISLTYNDKVKSWIELYLKKDKRLPYIIGLSDYYFPFFEEELEKNQMPHELKYLPIIESALNPQAVSRGAGATGLWQFIYYTGKRYGLENNSYVDDRRDPVKSTQAAIRYLKLAYDEYHDWLLVIASYNCGDGNVNKAIRRAGGKRDYWEIYPYLPRETRGYVPAFIAAIYIMNYYQLHNIVPVKVDFETETDTVMITQKLHLMQVAENLNIPIDQLRAMNPQYKRDIVPGDPQKPYALRLPYNMAPEFASKEKDIYKYKDSVFFDSKFALINPKMSKKTGFRSYEAGDVNPPSMKGKRQLYYTVQEGDNYGFIANWYNVRVSDLKYWNNSFSNHLSLGQQLVIYVPIKKYAYYEKINAMSFEQKQAAKGKISVSDSNLTASANTSVSDSKQGDSDFVWYQIQNGDNLWIIAQKYPGITDSDIKKINGFTNSKVKTLQAGQYIKIKRK